MIHIKYGLTTDEIEREICRLAPSVRHIQVELSDRRPGRDIFFLWGEGLILSSRLAISGRA